MPAHRVIVCGDRGWGDPDTIESALKLLQAEHGRRLFVCTGGCSRKDAKGRERSADALAIIACNRLGIEQVIYPANWAGYPDRQGKGNPAGILRNLRMLDDFGPNEVLAFHRFLPASTGTKHMVEQSNGRGIPVRLIEKLAVAASVEGEPCGSFGCTLPKGHNRGRADIPENHSSEGEAA